MKNMKKSLRSFIILTLLGIAGIIYAILFLPQDNYQQGLIYGITSGFILTGFLGMIYSFYLMRNPKKAKEAELQKNEERTQYIRMKTASSSAQVVLFAECIATLVIGLLGYKEISLTLGVVLFVQMIIGVGFSTYYSRKY
jgi:hypothetical protein